MSMQPYWKKILVPTDFSESSLSAVSEARRYLQFSQAEVLLLHVTEPAFEGLRIHTRELHDETQVQAREKLEAVAKEYFNEDDSVTFQLQEGRSGEVICEVARITEADVIFIASHGITALKHFVLGSVAEKVVRHAPCSVLVVR